jgi:N-methylhydantoinase A
VTTTGFVVGSDIGGTFTDTVVIDAAGAVHRHKSPTTPGNLVEGVLATFDLAAAELGCDRREFISRIRLFCHGTTVATNGLLERRGARTAVLQTAGFGDTLTIMRGYKGFDLDEATLKDWRRLVKHYSVIDPRLIREVPERIDHEGTVIRPLDEDAVRATARELLAEGVESVAVCLLWSTANPAHERRVGEILAAEAPGLYVSLSSAVLPRVGEYERTITTALNAFLGTEVRAATARLAGSLEAAGLAREPLLMQSNGGLVPVGHAARMPVSFLLSGPVGGVVGSQLVARELGEDNVVTADMGGTSFDVGLIVDGRPLLQPTTVIDAQPVGVPSVAVKTVGAGGGSIARVEGGALRVGPTSAGAEPGPVCYGRGGTEPTTTDADVVLGLINPDSFLGGRAKLDKEAAEHAIRTRIAAPLGLTTVEAAAGIKRIVDARMADLIRQVTVYQGHDPRTFALVAFGGAGPVHAAAFGAELGVKRIVVPITASVHSAFGIGASDLVVTRELSRTFRTPPGSEDPVAAHVSVAEVDAILAGLTAEATAPLSGQGLGPAAITVTAFVDMRFRSQIHELTVEVPPAPLSAADLETVVERFTEVYEARFGAGSAFTRAGVEMVTWRVVAEGMVDRPALNRGGGAASAAPPLRHDLIHDGGWLEAPVHGEAALAPGARIEGPAIVELADTTIVVGRPQVARVDGLRNVILEPKASAA